MCFHSCTGWMVSQNGAPPQNKMKHIGRNSSKFFRSYLGNLAVTQISSRFHPNEDDGTKRDLKVSFEYFDMAWTDSGFTCGWKTSVALPTRWLFSSTEKRKLNWSNCKPHSIDYLWSVFLYEKEYFNAYSMTGILITESLTEDNFF